MTIRTLLADDHELFLSGLRALLDPQPHISVVAEATNGYEAVEAALAEQPHVVVMDITMPRMNGIEATRRITEALPDTNVLCLSMHTDRQFVLAALEIGARGYLVKDCALNELTQAIQVLAQNEVYLSPHIASIVLKAYKADHAAVRSETGPQLSAREREVLQLLVEGHSTREVANQLHVSTKTVSTHRGHLMDKLGIHTIAGLTKYAVRQGWTSVDA